MRVQTSVKEHHLLKDQCERIRGRKERTFLRYGARRISRRGKRRFGRTSFWCHRGIGKNELDDKQR
jgi:hypothetical protein